jgi:release factor glutamine methyltransferase
MTVEAALRWGADALAAAGIEGARAEARLLLAAALGLGSEALLAASDRVPVAAALARFESLIVRRAAREPVAYLTGAREFWSLCFEVTPDTLIPRPESETLIEALLAHAADRTRGYRLLDLGTGSGCLLLALLSELPRAYGVGVDTSASALAVAARNARQLGLDARTGFVRGFWGRALAGRFDLVAVNPPYIAEGAELPADVARYEPPTALFAGPSGLEAYEALTLDLARLLAPEGVAAVEVGAGTADSVAARLAAAGLKVLECRRDLAGHQRCLVLGRADFRGS